MINLGDDMPGAIKFDERVEVRIVGADYVILHVNADHRSRRRYREHVESSLDVGSGAVLLDKVIEALDRAAEQLAIGEAIHDGVFVEDLGEGGDVADAKTLDIFSHSRNDVFKVLSRHSLNIL